MFFDLVDEHLAVAVDIPRAQLAELRARARPVEPRWIDFDDDPIGGSGAGDGLDLIVVEEQAFERVSGTFHSELLTPGKFSFAPLSPVPVFGQFERREVDVLDIEDVHFATDRWILLPVETETPPPEASGAREFSRNGSTFLGGNRLRLARRTCEEQEAPSCR